MTVHMFSIAHIDIEPESLDFRQTLTNGFMYRSTTHYLGSV